MPVHGGSESRVCPACAAEVPAGFAFCGLCGARLDEVPEPGERSDRRVVTILFADLSGFTSLAERLDPEDVTALLNECFGGLREEVEVRGGWLEKQIGDALMAVFGAPVAHEDDPLRAVRAGWAMHERMRLVNARLEPRIGSPIRLHVGVNTGLVVMAPGLGRGEGEELAVHGDTVNLAARLQGAATAGQLVVGDATQAATAAAFDYRRLPPLSLKGKAAPVAAYECLGPREQTPSAGTVPLGTPLVGREPELAALDERLVGLARGEGAIVAVVGEAGLGKSRLVAEARRRMPPEVRWLEGRTLSFGETSAYFPFLEVFKADAGLTEDEPDRERFRKLEARLGALLPADRVPDVLPSLAVLLSLELPEPLAERVRALDGEAMRHQIFRATRLVAEALARERPTALVFEDFHWADAASEALLEHVFPLVEQVPLLVCLPARPDPDTPADRLRRRAREQLPERYSEIVLAPLSAAETTELVQRLLQIELSPGIRRVLGKAEGNPFFLEEVVRSLVEVGAIARDSRTGRFEVVAQAGEITLPNTVQGVILARIDRLDDEAKQVLRTAAVIGRSFLHQVLRAVASLAGRLDARLEELNGLELIRENPTARELEYAFKHALTHEAVYESILLSRRRPLHGEVAHAIERLFPERLEEFSALLAYHYAQAEEWERARHYLVEAADRAGTLAADAEALAQYRQALTAHARVFGDRWDPLDRALFERKMGEAFFRRGQNDQALDHLERALEMLGVARPAKGAVLRELLRHVAYQLHLARRARDLSPEAEPLVRERQRIYEALAWISYALDDKGRFLYYALLPVNEGDRTGYALGIAAGSGGLGFVCDHIPLFRLAERYHRRAVALAEQIENPAAVGAANWGLGYYLFMVGRWVEARASLDRAMQVYRDAGELSKSAAPALFRALVDDVEGRFADALALGDDYLRLGEEIGDDRARQWFLLQTGRVLLRLGRVEAALERLNRGVEIARALPDHRATAWGLGVLSQALVAKDRLQEALDLIADAEVFVAERGLGGPEVTHIRIGRAQAALLVAERAFQGERADALTEARRACAAARKEQRFSRSGLPEVYRLEARYQWLRGRTKAATRLWRKSAVLAGQLGETYDVALAEIEAGQRVGDATRLARGEALLTDLRRVRERPAAAVEPPLAATPT